VGNANALTIGAQETKNKLSTKLSSRSFANGVECTNSTKK